MTFSSGKLIGKATLLICDTKCLDDFLVIILIRFSSVQEQGQTYILPHVNIGDQIKELVDDTDVPSSKYAHLTF